MPRLVSLKGYPPGPTSFEPSVPSGTFIFWPFQWLNKHQLDDKVKCQFCGLVVPRQRWSPNCPLLRRRTTNNVPLSGDDLDRVLPPIIYDICGANDPSSVVEGQILMSQIIESVPSVPSMPTRLRADATIASMALTATLAKPETCRAQAGSGIYFPKYPEFAVESARLRTFEAWPIGLKQKPYQLAEAGFYYTGVGDRVRCFSCGDGLKDWDDNAEPWEEHARWFGQCRFVKLIKGQEYINTMSVKPPPPANDKEWHVSPILAEDAVTIAGRITTSAEEEVSSFAASSSGDVVLPMPATKISTALPAVSNGTIIPKGRLCQICYGAEYSTAFRPCGHIMACAKCASSVTKCQICLKPVEKIVHISFSI